MADSDSASDLGLTQALQNSAVLSSIGEDVEPTSRAAAPTEIRIVSATSSNASSKTNGPKLTLRGIEQRKDLEAVFLARNRLIKRRKHEYGDQEMLASADIEDILDDLSIQSTGLTSAGRMSSSFFLGMEDLGEDEDDHDDELTPEKKVRASRNPRTPDLMFKGKSMFVLDVEHPIRKLMIDLADNIMFDNVILFFIMVNCLFLAWDNPLSISETTKSVLEVAEVVFLVIFVVELVVRVLAMGFVLNGSAYLRDPWNILDFAVVVAAIIPFVSNAQSNVTSLRTIRLLRPLRTVSTLPGLRLLVNSMAKAMPLLADVFLLMSFIFFLFGILGMQLFGGRLRQRCFSEQTDMWNTTIEHLCRIPSLPDEVWSCPVGHYCADSGINPNRDVAGFDNILQAWVTIVQCTSLEGWVDVTYFTWEGVSYWSTIYFILLILVVAFFLLQLITGVVYTAYVTAEEEEKEIADRLAETIALANKPKERADNTIAVLSQHVSSRDFLDLVGDAKLKAQQEAEEKLVAAINTTGNKTTEVELEDRIIIDDQANREKILREGYEHAWYSSDSVNRLVTAPWFDHVITATIILNTIVLMTYHFDPDVEGGMSSGFTAFLAYTNYTFTVVFYIEALLKIYGLSFGIYWRDGFNKFDFVVVVLSVIELLLVALNPGSVAFLSAFRTFRLLRVFKLAKNWPSLQKLVKTVVGTLDQVAYFSLLLVIFIYVFALLGMQLYAGKLYDDEGEVFRSNYDTFWWAVITVFQIIGGENWNDVMTNGIASNDWGAALYFVVLFVIGNYLVLNLFLAILLSNFDDDDEKDDAEKLKIQVEGEPQPQQSKKKKKKKRRFFRSGRKHKTPVAAEDMPVIHTRHGRFRGPSVVVTNDIELKVRAAEAEHHKTRKDRTASLPVSGGKTGEEYVLSPGLERATTKNNITVVGVDKSDTGHVLSATSDLKVLEIPEEEEEVELQDAADFAAKTSEKKVNVSIFIPTHGQQGYWVSPVVGTSTFFALKPDHWFRSLVAKIANSFALEVLVMVTIFLSVLVLCIDGPQVPPNSTLADVLWWLDIVNTCIFSMECVVKILAFGLFFSPNGYLKEWWNCLDFSIVALSIINFFFRGLNWVKAFRTLRSLRPLRVVSRNESLMVVIQSIFRAIPGVANVLLIAMLCIVVFGILGVNMFAGLFYRCETYEGSDMYQYDFNQEECLAAGLLWKNPDVGSFDNIFISMLTLFEVSTMEMWPDVLYRAVDVTAVGEAPVRDHTMMNSIYFVVYIIIGNFFISNLFVGMIVDTFSRMKTIVEGSAVLTKKQQMWMEMYRLMSHAKPEPIAVPPQDQQVRLAIFNFIQHDWFEYGVGVCIMLNVFLMSLWHFDMSTEYESVLSGFNYLFIALFFIEMCLKLIGLRSMYFASKWNVFDFLVVCGSLIDLAILISGTTDSGIDLSILRVFRLLRMVRLIEHNKGLKKLIETTILASNALLNVGGLMMLLFLIYAIAGMNLFGHLTKRDFLNEHSNFDNIFFAMFTLFRCATGESWNGIMHDCYPRTDGVDCDASIPGDCGSVMAVPYFVSFMFVGQFLMLNLFIAVLLDEFVGIGEKEEEDSIKTLSIGDLSEYASLWAKYGEAQPWYAYLFNRVVGDDTNEYLPWIKFQLLMRDLRGGLSLIHDPDQANDVASFRRTKSFSSLSAVNVGILKDTPTIPLKPITNVDGSVSLYVHYIDGLMALAHRAFKVNTRTAEGNSSQMEKEMASFPSNIIRLRILQNKIKSRYKGKTNIELLDVREADDRKRNDDTEISLAHVMAAQRIQAVFRGRKMRRALEQKMITEQARKDTVVERPVSLLEEEKEQDLEEEEEDGKMMAAVSPMEEDGDDEEADEAEAAEAEHKQPQQ